LLLLALCFHIVRRACKQRVQLRAGATGRKPVGDIVALPDLRPVVGELEDAHSLGDAEREPAGRVLVRVAGLIVVAENYEVSAGNLLAMLDRPLRLSAGLARASAAARRGDADRPEGVGVFLTLDRDDDVTERDRFSDLLRAIDEVGASAACAPLPAVALAVTDAEARLVAVRIANLLKSGIVVYCDEIVGVVAVTAAAFLRSRPSAMVAV